MVDAMRLLLLVLIYAFSLCTFADERKCENGKILVRGHYVNNYTRKDGTKVTGYFKDEYCRTSILKGEEIIFSDEMPSQWPYREKFKVWSKKEMEMVLSLLEELPEIFRKQHLKTIHRGTNSIFSKNPAASLPLNHSIVLYDNFFVNPEKPRVLAHEIAHLWYWELTNEQKKLFAVYSGWSFNPLTKTREKKKKNIYPDSADSPSEDFANNAEAYFYDSKKQKDFDRQLHDFYSLLIKDAK